ncbi:MAG: hypothetical protein ABI162_04925 [Luteolibacter sp.]
MNKTSASITLFMCALGLLVGYAAHKHGIEKENGAPVSKTERRRPPDIASGGNAVAIQLPQIHSDETRETMIARGENATYAGLALWMLDASAQDIAAYWEFRKNGKFDGDMKRLFFLNWTRLDPQAAIAAVAGTDNAATPWWAWAAQDPQAALAAAGPDRMKDVARGIGEFQPEWLREHFDQIPEAFREQALNGVMTWSEDGDSVATLDFLKKQGIGFPGFLFRTLARKDPWAAFDWLEKNDKLDPRDNGPIDILLDAMKSEHPDDLERLAATTPSGALKRKLEDAVFANLLATDPDAAMAQAKATKTPLVEARRLATIGASLLIADPEKAFSIGADILVVSPEKLGPEMQIQYADSRARWGMEKNPAATFMDSLLIKDPARTLDMTTVGTGPVSGTFKDLSEKWAERDLVAYSEWVNLQTDPRIRNPASRQVVSQLSSQGQFHEAAEWAMSGEKPDSNSLYGLAHQWSRSNRAEASAWLESADLPESEKASLRNFIKRNE